MNEQNLVPFGKMSPERQREISRMGGIASGQARARRAYMRVRTKGCKSTPLLPHSFLLYYTPILPTGQPRAKDVYKRQIFNCIGARQAHIGAE